MYHRLLQNGMASADIRKVNRNGANPSHEPDVRRMLEKMVNQDPKSGRLAVCHLPDPCLDAEKGKECTGRPVQTEHHRITAPTCRQATIIKFDDDKVDYIKSLRHGYCATTSYSGYRRDDDEDDTDDTRDWSKKREASDEAQSLYHVVQWVYPTALDERNMCRFGLLTGATCERSVSFDIGRRDTHPRAETCIARRRRLV